MPTQTSQERLSAATAAVAAVKAKLRYGAGNRADDRERTYQREHLNFERAAKEMGYGPGSVWAAGQLSRYVAELKVIAMRVEDFFGKLGKSKGVQRIRDIANQAKQLDIMFLTNNKHAFVLIGKKADAGIDPLTWGSEVIVCDPWNDEAYVLDDKYASAMLLQKMQCDCTTASSQIRVE